MKFRLLILPIFFLSGFTGLLYEIIWLRQLSLIFGVSAFAVSSVLTVFMGGLGLGSFLAGRIIDQRSSPLKIYAAIELGIGLYALFLPMGIQLITPAYLALFPFAEGNFYLISLVRFFLSFLLLIIPATLMGATFPIISRFFVQEEEEIGKDAGTLYAFNTLGAVFGCLLTGFYLIETFGVLYALYIAAGINFILAVVSFFLSQWESPATWQGDSDEKTKSGPGKKEVKPKENHLLLYLFGLSGFVALSLEVLWTRIFVFLIDNTTYAFTSILSTFLTGIVAGSLVFSRLKLKEENLRATFGKMQALVGISGLLTLVLFLTHDPVAQLWNEVGFKIMKGVGGDFWTGKIVASFLFIFSLLLLPTFLMGATFPVVFKLCSNEFASAGRRLGLLYSINTVGAISGSFCAGFILLPLFGAQKAVIFISILSFLSGIFILRSCTKKIFRRSLIGMSIPAIFLLGLIFYAGDVPQKISVDKLDQGNEVQFYKEGITGTVFVSSRENDLTPYRKPIKRIWINGDPIAGSFREALQLEWLQAHIPLLLHPNPEDTAVICFGTGSTAGAMSEHPVKKIFAIDTAREVFEAAPYFKEGNRNVLENEKFEAVVEDGRQFLATTKRKFDFITSEPPPPSNAGIVSLYTREYYETCLSKMKPGGMVSQWIPLHHLSVPDFKSLVATFVSAFPHSTLWYTKWDAIMIGSDEKLTVDFAQLKERMEDKKIQGSLREIGFGNPFRLLSTFMMGEENLRKYIEGAEVVTDDRPTVEFTAPRIHQIGTTIKGDNLRELLKYREPVNPIVRNADKNNFENDFSPFYESQNRYYEGRLYENDKNLAKAVEKFKEAVNLELSFANARFAFLKIQMSLAYHFLGQRKASAGLRVIRECMEWDKEGAFRPQLLNLRGLFQLSKKEYALAAMDFMGALELDRDFPAPHMNLGTLYAQYLNDPGKAVSFYRQCLNLKITKEEREMMEREILKLEKL